MVEILPAVNLYRGNIVSDNEEPIVSRKPKEYLSPLYEKFNRVLLFDLDGIRRNKPNWPILKSLEGKDTWIDAGVRFAEAVCEPFLTGASKVVLSTTTLRGIKELEGAFKLSENIVFRVELDKKDLNVNGMSFQMPIEDILAEIEDIGIKELILTSEPSSLYLLKEQIDKIIELRDLSHFNLYLAVPDDFDDSRLEGRKVAAIVKAAKGLS